MLRPLSFVTKVGLWILQHADCFQPEPKQAWGHRNMCFMQVWPQESSGLDLLILLVFAAHQMRNLLHGYTAVVCRSLHQTKKLHFYLCISGWVTANFIKVCLLCSLFNWKTKWTAIKTLQQIARNVFFFIAVEVKCNTMHMFCSKLARHTWIMTPTLVNLHGYTCIETSWLSGKCMHCRHFVF